MPKYGKTGHILQTALSAKYKQKLQLRLYNHSALDIKSWCINWTGCKLPAGYGRMPISINGEVYYTYSHIISYILNYGPLPEGNLYVCHRCDNPTCVNPAHLFLGTHKQNIQDSLAKGRWCHQTGKAYKGMKFNSETVLLVQAVQQLKTENPKLSQRKIAAMLGIKRARVEYALKLKTC